MFIGKQIFKVITRNNLSQVEYILSLYKLKLKLCLTILHTHLRKGDMQPYMGEKV